MRTARYIIVLDRGYEDDGGGEDHDGTAQQACEQVARELQYAVDSTGTPAGFFQVVDRRLIEDQYALPRKDTDAVAADIGIKRVMEDDAKVLRSIDKTHLVIAPDLDYEPGSDLLDLRKLDDPFGGAWQVLVSLPDGGFIAPPEGCDRLSLRRASAILNGGKIVGDINAPETIHLSNHKGADNDE